MTRKRIPALRFAGFTDDWEKKAPVEVFCDFLNMRKKSATVGGNGYGR